MFELLIVLGLPATKISEINEELCLLAYIWMGPSSGISVKWRTTLCKCVGEGPHI